MKNNLIADEIQNFLEDFKIVSKRSELTIKQYEINLNEFNLYCFNSQGTISEMATLRARDIIEQWFKKVAADKNLSASSLNQRLVSLSMFYQFLIGELYDIREVTKGIPKFADTEPMTKKKFLDMDEAKNLINLVEKKEDKKLTEYENARNELIIKLFLGCGLRISELSKLEYKHIAIGESRIYITSDIAKFGKSRIVDIPQSVLRTYIEYLKLRKEHKNSSNFLFISRRNNVIHTNTIRHLVAKASEQATGEKINPHGLRHTYGTQQIAAGQDPLYVSQQMGHANLEITTGIYVHQAKNTQNRANNNPFFQ